MYQIWVNKYLQGSGSELWWEFCWEKLGWRDMQEKNTGHSSITALWGQNGATFVRSNGTSRVRSCWDPSNKGAAFCLNGKVQSRSSRAFSRISLWYPMGPYGHTSGKAQVCWLPSREELSAASVWKRKKMYYFEFAKFEPYIPWPPSFWAQFYTHSWLRAHKL